MPRQLLRLIGKLSFPLIPNMVLSNMKNHEHRTKQTNESYTFQPFMGFWFENINTDLPWEVESGPNDSYVTLQPLNLTWQ